MNMGSFLWQRAPLQQKHCLVKVGRTFYLGKGVNMLKLSLTRENKT